MELLEKNKETVKVRRLARVPEMIGSFSLTMGNMCRFYTRGMMFLKMGE